MPWFKIQMANGNKPAVIDIIGVIGSKNWMDDSGITFKELKDSVDSLGDVAEIDVNLHSPGGDVWAGVPIYNYLRNHPAKINIRVLGEASSIASVILLAGDTRIVPKNSISLIHDVAGVLFGVFNSAQLDKIKEQLEKTREAILNVYEERLTLSREKITEIMKADTYMTADEALEWGFATEIDEPLKIVASAADVKMNHEQLVMQVQITAKDTEIVALREKINTLSSDLSQTKGQLLALQQPPIAAEATRVIELCEAQGFVNLSAQMIKNKLPEKDVSQRLELMSRIKDVCMVAHVPVDSVLKHIDNIPDMIRVGITEALAAADVPIDNHIHVTNGRANTSKNIDPNKIYAQRRGN